MTCVNRQFGEIEFQSEHVFHFADGLIGFEHLKRFIIVTDAQVEPFRWLVSVEDEDVALPIIDPNLVVENYCGINNFSTSDVVAVVASLKDPIEESTVNLRSPIIFDAQVKKAQQIILPDERFAVQYRFIGAPLVAEGVS